MSTALYYGGKCTLCATASLSAMSKKCRGHTHLTFGGWLRGVKRMVQCCPTADTLSRLLFSELRMVQLMEHFARFPST